MWSSLYYGLDIFFFLSAGVQSFFLNLYYIEIFQSFFTSSDRSLDFCFKIVRYWLLRVRRILRVNSNRFLIQMPHLKSTVELIRGLACEGGQKHLKNRDNRKLTELWTHIYSLHIFSAQKLNTAQEKQTCSFFPIKYKFMI